MHYMALLMMQNKATLKFNSMLVLFSCWVIHKSESYIIPFDERCSTVEMVLI